MSTNADRSLRFGPAAPILIILALFFLSGPATASADSIVFVKGGDVWLSSADGSNQFQVTRNGGYEYASQSDAGVIVASNGSNIHRLSRSGELLANLPTVAAGPGWYGPYEPQISPDGSKIAYEFFTTYGGDTRNGTVHVSAADGSLIGELQTGWSYPAWIGNDRTMQSGAPNVLSEDVIIRGVTEPNNSGTQWFSHPDAGGVRDGEITAAGDKLAFVAGESDEYLTVYRQAGQIGVDVPEYCYHYGEATGGKFRSPSFSPDGGSLAWEEGDGIYVGPIPDFAAGCSMATIEGPLTIPGGSYPDWGPAGVPAPRKAGIQVAGKPRLRAALKKGLTVNLRDLPEGTRVTAEITKQVARKSGLGRKAKVVARGASDANGAAEVRFTKPAARKLGKLRSLPLRLRATAADSRAELKLTLRR